MAVAIDRPMLVAAATDETTSGGIHTGRLGARGFHHHVSWGTGVTSGVVEVEYASDPAYTGTWAPVATVTFAGTAPNENYVYSPGCPKAMRHRISTVVVGGTVTTRLVGDA